jgi:hypothetical protein
MAAEKKAPIACLETGDGGHSLTCRICGDILTAERAWQEAKSDVSELFHNSHGEGMVFQG